MFVPSSTPGRRRIALVTQGFNVGGGVSTVSHWLRNGLESTGTYSIDIFDLATSSKDDASRRLARPKTWLRKSLLSQTFFEGGVQHWGANAVEVELMRYRPRVELTQVLRAYDLIQVVAGGPALTAAVAKVGVPIVLQVATTAAWERQSHISDHPKVGRAWRRAMTSLISRVELSAINSADVVLVENDAMLHHVSSIGHRNVVKSPPGVDTNRFTPGLKGWQGHGYLLSVCRLGDARKGIDRMLLAYSEMVRTDATIPDLLLAGRGTLIPGTAGLIRNLGLASRVQVRSDVDAEELVRLYQGASVFLQTSHEEGLGISVLEAMACGLPVVCTDTAGTRETVSCGKTGWLVAQDADHVVAREVAKRVLATLGAGSTMGAYGRDRCLRRFSHEVTLRRFISVYDSLLGDATIGTT